RSDSCRRGSQCDQLRRIALRERLARLGQRRIEQRRLSTQQLIDVFGQSRPLLLGQIEVAAQVEQRGLLDRAADATGLNEAEGRVRLA
ncbi:MAG TPA: hypothetical protein VET87_21875, partial [Rubrivivax sp.]|nr:hypothetical protein [Rubrivivax sp.]